MKINLYTPPSRTRRRSRLLVAALCLTAVASAVRAADMRDEVLDRVKHATLYAVTSRSKQSQSDTPLEAGSGFFINRTGLAITNNHVVDPAHGTPPWEKWKAFLEHYEGGKLSWRVTVDSGTKEEKSYKATVLYQNEAADQAVLQVFDEDGSMLATPNYLRLLPESRLQEYKETWAFGFPGATTQASRGKNPKVQVEKGNILKLPRTPGSRLRMIYTDNLIRPGNSGGPCVDVNGFLIGTVTLMKAPEGREDTGGARYCALVPAKLTAEMVRNAYLLEKIGKGTDFTPFLQSVMQGSGLINVPEFERWKDSDRLFLDNGDAIPGTMSDSEMGWKSDLGTFSVPVTSIAYLMRNADGSELFLEGGNRISGEPTKDKIPFKMGGDRSVDVSLDEVSVVAFRTGGHVVRTMPRRTILFDADVARLAFEKVDGDLSMSSRLGDWPMEFAKIERIDANDAGEQVVTMTDGSRLSGSIKADDLKGKLAGLDTTLTFNLANVRTAAVEVIEEEKSRLAGLSIEALLKKSPQELRDAWTLLGTDAKAGAKRIEDLADAKNIKHYAEPDQERARLMLALAELRTGDGTAAMKEFRIVSKSNDENVAAYAQSHAEVLREFRDFKYDGKALSDPAVFAAAAKSSAKSGLDDARSFLKSVTPPHIERKGDYRTLMNTLRNHEREMASSAVILGTEAEDVMIRLWKTAIDAGIQELIRMYREEQAEKAEQKNQPGGRRGRSSRRGNSAAMGREKDSAKVVEDLEEYYGKQRAYGFHIVDPDVDAIKARH